MSRLWRGHPATASQERLVFEARTKHQQRLTQADIIIALLRKAREQGKALGLPEIMAAGIAQHGARFNEIRSRGFVVRNETLRGADGIRSSYFLEFDPEESRAL